MDSNIQLARILSGMNYKPCKRESQLEDQVVKRLEKNEIKFQRQFIASKDDRFDILVDGGIVLELKVDGSVSELLRQIERYAQYDYVTTIIVVTTRASHRQLTAVGEIHGKRIGVIHVGWF